MYQNKFGELVFTETDICELYLTDADKKYKRFVVNEKIEFPKELNLENLPNLVDETIDNISIESFDSSNQNKWHMPTKYYEMDIAQFVLEQCKNDVELQRAGQELLLFQERNLFILLKYLKYLVDTMREHNIVWGVGRGSSVASFVLYLIGIHRINSLYYDLSIEEFLK